MFGWQAADAIIGCSIWAEVARSCRAAVGEYERVLSGAPQRHVGMPVVADGPNLMGWSAIRIMPDLLAVRASSAGVDMRTEPAIGDI